MRNTLLGFTLLLAANAVAQGPKSENISMMNDVSMPYLQKLISAGRSNYPKFRLNVAKVNAAKAAYDKTKWGVLDFISLSYIYYPTTAFSVIGPSGNASYMSGYQFGLFLNVGNMLQKPSTIKRAKYEYIAAEMDQQASDEDLDQEVRKRYFTYVETSNILKLKTMATTDASDVLQHIKYKFEKGEVSFESYNQALLSYSTYSQEKITAEAALLIAKTSLEEIVGTTLESIKQ